MQQLKIALVRMLHGELCVINEADLPAVSAYSWYFNNGYAYARIHGRPVALHAFLMKTPVGMHTDHINRNKMDNRRQNLRIVDPKTNILNRRNFNGPNNPFYGKNHSEDFRKWTSTRFSKEISQYDLDMNYLNTYKNAIEAAKTTGISRGNISSCSNGKRKTAGGYIWKK